MIILGIDQSLRSTGYILMEQHSNGKYKVLAHGIISTNLQRSVNKINSTVNRIRTILSQLHQYAEQADEVWMESVSYQSQGNATRDLAMLFMALQLRFNCKWVAPTTLKKFATGKGNNKGKQCMFDALPPAAQRVFGNVPKTKGRDDLVDAFWICKYAFSLKG